MRGHIQTSHVDHGFQLSTLNSLKTTGDFNLKFYDQEVDFQLFKLRIGNIHPYTIYFQIFPSKGNSQRDWLFSKIYNSNCNQAHISFTRHTFYKINLFVV